MKKVLIVEDDELIINLERDYLIAGDFEVDTALDGKNGLKLYMDNDYDLIILDVMLPEMDGFELCRIIRSESNVPVMMITARKEDIDKIRGLGLGADDYMVKPFSPAEMVARVNAHIKMHQRLESADPKSKQVQNIAIKDLKINPETRRVFVNEKEISLVNKEYELLLFLAENPDIVFSKETLFDRVWGMDAIGDTATVTVHINRLREKIEADMSNPKYIETVWGAGYRFKLD